MSSLIPPGTQMDSYRIEALLGEGGMAQVYRAWHTGLQRHEALKALLPHLAHDRQFVERFLQEARTAAGLHHPNIATIHTVSTPQAAQPYFTMQMIEGGDLSELLQNARRLSLSEALPLLTQIADALDYAHGRGIIHRDVKPANILLERYGDHQLRVKLVDFGIARAQEGGNARLTKTGMIVGTPEYMSPEQAEGKADVGPASDLYALGIVAYEMLCGQPPFRGGAGISAIAVIMSHLRDQPAPPSGHVPGLPAPVDTAVLTALAKNPDDRFASCMAFVDALAAALPRPVRTPTLMDTHQGREPSPVPRPSRAPALVALCFVLAACSLFAGRAWQNAQAARQVKTEEANSGQAQTLAQAAKRDIEDVERSIEYNTVLKEKGKLSAEEGHQVAVQIRAKCATALDQSNKALRLNPTNQLAHLERGWALWYKGDAAAAGQEADSSLRLFPGNESFKYLQNTAYSRLQSKTKK